MEQVAPHRARTLEEFGRISARLSTPDEMAAGIAAYRPRPTDVVITPYGKCGTTWTQQIFHTLRTHGDLDFDDISRVAPWIETAAVLGLDLEAPQKAEPRGFKSHLDYQRIPKGARYVVPFRDPKDALVSAFRFMEGWMIEPGAIPIEDFARQWIGRSRRGGDIWRHLLSWWAVREKPDVLLLTYEHMLADPALAIRRIAAFSGIPLDEPLLALTLEWSSLPFMLAHKSKFDDLLMRQASESRCDIPRGGDSAKVRKGESGGARQELPPDILALLDEAWRALVTPATGFADYAAFEAAVRTQAAERT